MRHREVAGESTNPARQESNALRIRRFLTRFEKQLKSEADAEDRPSCSGNLSYRVTETGRAESTGPLTEIPYPRHQHAVRSTHCLGVSGELRRIATGSEGSHHTGQIVHAIIDYDNHRAPLVEGTPVTRGSWLVAPSS